MKKTIVSMSLAAVLLLFVTFSVFAWDWEPVAEGHLNAFGDDVTIGEVFDVVSDYNVTWEAFELDASDPDSEEHYLVEASWYNTDEDEVVIQFVVEKYGEAFELWGATVNGEFMDADVVIDGIIEAYWDNY